MCHGWHIHHIWISTGLQPHTAWHIFHIWIANGLQPHTACHIYHIWIATGLQPHTAWHMSLVLMVSGFISSQSMAHVPRIDGHWLYILLLYGTCATC
jgi:hypothetical protein